MILRKLEKDLGLIFSSPSDFAFAEDESIYKVVQIPISEFATEITDILLEAVSQMCSVKKLFLEISQNSQENTWHSSHSESPW